MLPSLLHTSRASRHLSLCLGGTSLSRYVYFTFPRSCNPGEYRVRVRVSDRVGERSAVEEYRCEVYPRTSFGTIDLRLSRDKDGTTPAGANLTVGETVYLNFSVVGFATTGSRIHVSSTLSILDEDRRPVAAEPFSSDHDQPAPDLLDSAIPICYAIPATRTGKFVLRIELRDHVANKTASYNLPILVSLPPQLGL